MAQISETLSHLTSGYLSAIPQGMLIPILLGLVCVCVATYFLLQPAGTQAGTLTEVIVYPIKSCGGMSIPLWPVTPRGLLHDRQFMLVTSTDNHFVSQRTCPRMCLIEVDVDLEQKCLYVMAEDMETLVVSLEEPNTGELREATVWGDTVKTIDVGDDAAAWFQNFLGQEDIRLVRMCDDARRSCDPSYAPDSQCALNDGYPFLLCSLSSLASLNARLEEPITIDRFRPNLVVSGAPEWEEDLWGDITIGGMKMRVCKPCDRCKIPTVDPMTGESNPQITSVLQSFRTGEAIGYINDKWKKSVFFGQNLTHSTCGIIQVGGPVRVISKNNLLKAKAK